MYIENWIKNMVDNLVKKQGTTNPEELIESKKNVTFQYIHLTDNLKGFYKHISHKKQFIGVNEALEGHEKEFTLFHELAHAVMKHKGEVVHSRTSINVSKEERHADLFATYMLVLHNNITRENVNDFILPKRAKDLINRFL